MQKYIISLGFLFSILLLLSCSDVIDSNENEISSDWLIPVDQVFDGGPGKDGIPALTTPTFIPASQVSYLSNSDLVIIVKQGNAVKVYPHPILDWHEIINDNIGSSSVAVTYCPLTGSAIGWNRNINGSVTTYGVSGLLYNTNLIPYDRGSNSNWSQMKLLCVNGSLSGSTPELIPLIETTFLTAKEMYPNAEYVSTNTGFNRSYGNYPYGDYKTNNNRLLFPIENQDSRLLQKERVLGVLGGSLAGAFALNRFSDSTTIINDQLGTNSIIVIGNKSKNIITAFESKINDTMHTFTAVQNQLPVLMTDESGTSWDIFGQGVAGPRTGESLTPVKGFIAYWFAWATFYPHTTINN